MNKQKAPKLPPIHYLVAFESAARCNSFKMAAKELGITPSAISQQIKSLETHLGLPLFTRKTRSIYLTEAGESFYQVASQTITYYQEGFKQFTQQLYALTLKVSMFSYIADEVVLPNLHAFQNTYPAIDLLIETTMRVENIENTDLDCAIRFGTPPWKGCHHRLISPVKFNLLASEKYLAHNPFNQNGHPQAHTLIHIRAGINDWSQLIGEYNIQPTDELFFNAYTAAINAAEQGLGIVIGLFPSTEPALHAGKLMPLLQENLPIEEAYYFVTKANPTKREALNQLHTWLTGLFNAF